MLDEASLAHLGGDASQSNDNAMDNAESKQKQEDTGSIAASSTTGTTGNNGNPVLTLDYQGAIQHMQEQLSLPSEDQVKALALIYNEQVSRNYTLTEEQLKNQKSMEGKLNVLHAYLHTQLKMVAGNVLLYIAENNLVGYIKELQGMTNLQLSALNEDVRNLKTSTDIKPIKPQNTRYMLEKDQAIAGHNRGARLAFWKAYDAETQLRSKEDYGDDEFRNNTHSDLLEHSSRYKNFYANTKLELEDKLENLTEVYLSELTLSEKVEQQYNHEKVELAAAQEKVDLLAAFISNTTVILTLVDKIVGDFIRLNLQITDSSITSALHGTVILSGVPPGQQILVYATTDHRLGVIWHYAKELGARISLSGCTIAFSILTNTRVSRVSLDQDCRSASRALDKIIREWTDGEIIDKFRDVNIFWSYQLLMIISDEWSGKQELAHLFAHILDLYGQYSQATANRLTKTQESDLLHKLHLANAFPENGGMWIYQALTRKLQEMQNASVFKLSPSAPNSVTPSTSKGNGNTTISSKTPVKSATTLQDRQDQGAAAAEKRLTRLQDVMLMVTDDLTKEVTVEDARMLDSGKQHFYVALKVPCSKCNSSNYNKRCKPRCCTKQCQKCLLFGHYANNCHNTQSIDGKPVIK